jgi:heme/copper-type cytochrome/quinol oxidase subunit 1
VDANHWRATTLEWAATTSPPLAHGNFAVLPVVQRGPYEYSSPESIESDFLPQHVVVRESFTPAGGMLPASVVAQREV